MRVALTGGIASGKSAVAEAFAARGVPVIDTDVIARDVVGAGLPALAEIVAVFGSEVLDSDGHLDRKHLRELIFSDPQRRRQLEAILHPAIAREMQTRIAAAGGDYQIIVVPLLLEAGLEGEFERILVVDCAESLQLERLIARDGESETSARRILDAQAERRARVAHADDVIVNDGDLSQLKTAVEKLDHAYRMLVA